MIAELCTTVWNTNDPEWFDLFNLSFDVLLARTILSKRKRIPLGRLKVADVSNWIIQPNVLAMGIWVDWEKVLAEQNNSVDISVPVILAWMPTKFKHAPSTLFPIEGWHRIAKASRQGVEYLPAVALNKADSRKVLAK